MPSDPMIAQWRALAADPSDRRTWIDTAKTLAAAGRRDESRAVLASTLERWPDAADAWVAASFGGRREAAEAAMLRVTALAPGDASAWRRLGEVIASQQPDRALQAFAKALELDPGDAAAHRGAGLALLRLGRLDEAGRALAQAFERAPNDAASHRLASFLLLDCGKAAAGWRHLAQSRAPLDQEWDGSDPSGRTIAVLAEGTLEDALPLLGAVSVLAGRGAKVVISAPAAWTSLLAGLRGVSLRAQGEKLDDCSAAIPLARLPWRLGLTAALPPARITPTGDVRILAPVGTRLKVGLLWNSIRPEDDGALGFEHLLPLTGLAGATFYGLQTGARAADVKKLADPALVADLSPDLRSLGDLACAVSQMDVVITVEGPMDCLARAVGTPVWLLLPHHTERRWGDEKDLRLFRQPRPDDWRAVIAEVEKALSDWLARRPRPAAEQAPMLVDSIFPDATGKPRFRMTAPRHFLSDPGIRYLVARERSGVGYEYATRSFLDAHLQPGDLFVDIGAHWGIMSLQAATRWPGQVRSLAIEPSPHNLGHLKDWLSVNGVDNQTEIVWAFAADAPGRGQLAPQSTMGHSLIRAEDGTIPVVTIDGLLAERPALRASGRVVVKIDVEGNEPEVIEGMKDLIAAGSVAAVIWERGRDYDSPEGQKRLAALRARFAAWGYSAWRFDSEEQAGPLVPFVEDGRLGNIFELRADIAPLPVYGDKRPKPMPQPADPVLDAALKSRSLFALGLDAHKQGKTAEARDLYRQAALLDGTQSGPYNNLGAVFRNQNNRPAAAASFRRARHLAPDDLGVLSNCGNSLREIGAFDEAEATLRRALVQRPNDAGLIYNLGVLRKDTDRPQQAVTLFERALRLSPEDPEYRWDRALALLQAGDYVRGFEAYESRWGLKRAAKRKISLPRWDGSPLTGRSLFLSDEQGFGDVLQWARFVAPLKKMGAGRIVMECQPELMRLISLLPEVDEVVPRAKLVPDCDLTLPLLSLPHLLGTTLATLPNVVPYLRAPETEHRLPDDGRLKVGLVWAGKPTPRDRSIGLERLLPLLGDPKIAAYSLQIGPRAADIGKLGADLLVTDLAPKLTDFAETAAILRQLDLLITIDSAVAHLAGGLGVKTFLLLRKVSDWRWFDDRSDSPWYPSLTLFRQKELDVWDGVVEELASCI